MCVIIVYRIMANTPSVTFAIVQYNEQHLCVLPSTWLYIGKWFEHGETDNNIRIAGADKGFWPKTSHSAMSDFKRAIKCELICPTAENSKPFRCKVKLCDIETYDQVMVCHLLYFI